MNYCSNCGHPVVLKVPKDDTHARYVCDNCGMIHYQNPRVIVGSLPLWEDKILICKRAIEPRAGLWTIPAGFMENKETLEEGALRETLEESGAHVNIIRLHSVYSLPQVNQVYIIYLAQMESAFFDPGIESLECRLVTPDKIPWDEIAFSAIRFSLEKFLENEGNECPRVFVGTLGDTL